MIYISLQLDQTPVTIEEVTGLNSENAQELLDDLNDCIGTRATETSYFTLISQHLFRNYDRASWRVVARRGEVEVFRMDFIRSKSSVPIVEEPVTRISRFEREDVI
jgi:hypothetical protein